MYRAICVAATFAASILAQSPSGVVINELNYDDSNTDDFEFVEIFNAGPNTVDMTGWTLNGIDGTTAGNGTYNFPIGLMLAPGEFWVVGQAGVPNVDDSLGALGLENGADGVWLEDQNFVVQDGITWEMWDWTNPLPTWLEGEGLWGAIQGTDFAGSLLSSIGRAIDGVDTDDNGCDFREMPASPGELNIGAATVGSFYVQDCDGPVGTTFVNDFTYSFAPGNVQDPAAVQVAIISTIPQPTVAFPASPQGGNISVWHDATGGGNANVLKNIATSEYLLETYVYVTGPNANFDADDGEQWVIGVRGHTDSFGEFWDVGGFLSLISCGGGSTVQPGHTGIAWYHHRTASVSDLYLIDFGNGGSFTVLAGPINIQAGVNDGWQRLRLEVTGGNVNANFGGTYGANDGTVFSTVTSTTCANAAYVTYRECITDNNNMQPLMLDAIQILDPAGGPAASFATFGAGCPSPAGISSLACPQLPVIGTPLEVSMDNVSPTGLPLFIVGFTTVPGGFPISLIGLTPDVTCLAYVTLDALVGPLGTLGGVASVILPIPNNAGIVGTDLHFQGTQLELTNGDWNLTEGGTATIGF